jgi:hypothetical protein
MPLSPLVWTTEATPSCNKSFIPTHASPPSEKMGLPRDSEVPELAQTPNPPLRGTSAPFTRHPPFTAPWIVAGYATVPTTLSPYSELVTL